LVTTRPTGLDNALDVLGRLPIGHFIDGGFVPGDESKTSAVTDPATAGRLCEAPLGGASEVDDAVAAASKAADGWRARTPAERAVLLVELAARIEDEAEVFAQLESLNVGKPLSVARDEVSLTADALRFMAGAVRSTVSPAAGEYVTGQLSMIRREPLGVIGAITPWNYPLMMAAWKIAPALVVGNTIVLKPSELTPLTTLKLAELAADILPAGVLNVVLGTGDQVGTELSRHPGIAMVSLTGSTASGISVAANAATTVKRLHLELGGKAPVVVFPDADVDEAASTLRMMGYWNAGQECGAATRVLCASEIYDPLLERLLAATARTIVGGPADDPEPDVGPLISERHLLRVASLVDGARELGATIYAGGSRLDRAGYFFEPTVVGDLPAQARLANEEIFGPVITLERFTTEEEAISAANALPFGLAASVWTADVGRAVRVSDALHFGTVWVNSHLTLASEMPWGGFGRSGYGRDMSVYALDDYVRTKHVMIATGA
jgi:1-pyrroline dehydrogenase